MSLNLTNFHFTILFVSRPKLMKALVTNPYPFMIMWPQHVALGRQVTPLTHQLLPI